MRTRLIAGVAVHYSMIMATEPVISIQTNAPTVTKTKRRAKAPITRNG
jgi:hypothetical protein